MYAKLQRYSRYHRSLPSSSPIKPDLTPLLALLRLTVHPTFVLTPQSSHTSQYKHGEPTAQPPACLIYTSRYRALRCPSVCAPPSSMAKRLFHSCRSPSAADAVVSHTTTLLASDRPRVGSGPAGEWCARSLPRWRPQQPGVRGARGCATGYAADDLHAPARGTPAYRWLKSSQWHVVEAAGVTDDDDTPRLKIDARRRLRRSRRHHRHRLHRRVDRASGSSGDSGWFTSDEESYANSCGVGGEAETLVTSTTTESSSGASGHCGVEADVVVAGSFAVVKRSDDPRGDFRRSMAEMVIGRSIYDADGLERLLRCFLALNHKRHRRDIVEAFGDVWEAVFSNATSQHQHGIVTSEPAICKAAAAKSNRQ
ncbi:hypothetical protein GUJ93_ZPchr0006g44466 [Zizania palustris]|uniref:Transcription repressor n=1 Tax=Zizania palustris TaxID=103762 RepID=A0A8J5T566_ZIZPA|nr:hypothetical protein GUJ93_ZPchr0006g44466 [Zizania palustris]